MTTTISPPHQQPEHLTAASMQTSRVSPKTVDGAVNALLKWRTEKSKTEKPQLLETDEYVYLIVTLKKIPQTNRTNAYRIPLPHPLINPVSDSPEICLIIDDRPKSHLTKDDAMKKIKTENIPITKILKLSKLKTDYKAYEAKRKLCDSYDMFFSDRRIVHLLPRLIGKKFFASKKIPVPVDLKHKNWKEQMEKAFGSAFFYMRTGTCSVIKIGKLSMESDEIVENVMKGLNGVVEILPNKWKYVRSLHLKLSESVALPVYQSVPDLKLKIDGTEGEKSVVVVKEKKKKGEGEGGDDVAVVDGSEKKKKGRIHEVRYMDSDVTELLDDDDELVVESGDDDDVEMMVESAGEVKKNNKRKKEVAEVTESEKPLKKAAKEKTPTKAKVVKPVKKVAEIEKPVKKVVKEKTLTKAKIVKPVKETSKVVEIEKPVKKETSKAVEIEKPVKKVVKGKVNEKKSKDVITPPKKAKVVVKEESSGSGGLKQKRKKSVLRK